MTNFEYACPSTEQEAVEFLSEHRDQTAVLAAGTDLVSLLKSRVLEPKRVVDISGIESLRGIHSTADGVEIGVLATLEDLDRSPELRAFPSLSDVVRGVHAIQIQQNGTLGGDLCHLPNCWYFRNGYGLLARDDRRSLADEGDNRYHAIFGNRGAAKFVSASRFAPALIAWEAEVRIAGPEPDDSQWIPLQQFYATPRAERHGISVLQPGQFITHVRLAPAVDRLSATYEVLEMQGLDWPLAAAACTLEMDGLLVRRARIVLGQCAPTPWVSEIAASHLVGKPITRQTADEAGQVAVSEATPLRHNEYKVQLAKTSVKRALLRASGQA